MSSQEGQTGHPDWEKMKAMVVMMMIQDSGFPIWTEQREKGGSWGELKSVTKLTVAGVTFVTRDVRRETLDMFHLLETEGMKLARQGGTCL